MWGWASLDIFSLVKNGTITFPKLLFHHYKTLGLTDTQFLLALHLMLFHEEGKSFPSIQEIEKRMGLTSTQIMKEMQALITGRFLELQQEVDQWGKMSESYDLDPLYHQLLQHLDLTEQKNKGLEATIDSNLFSQIEQEFGRPLSPVEIEYVTQWIDQDKYKTNMILAALHESKVVGKINIKYIDRILLEWSSKNIQTVDDARAYALQFRNKQFQRMEQKRNLIAAKE